MYFNFQNEGALTLRFSPARAGRIVGGGNGQGRGSQAGRVVGRHWPTRLWRGADDQGRGAQVGRIVGRRRRPRERGAREVWAEEGEGTGQSRVPGRLGKQKEKNDTWGQF